jgi:hypothetical protein
MAQGDAAALAEALARNVWRGAEGVPAGASQRLARLVLDHAAALDAMPAEDLMAGRLRFADAEAALA